MSYETLIRTILSTRCLMVYEALNLTKNRDREETVAEILLTKLEDKDAWRTVFANRSIHVLLQHYTNMIMTTKFPNHGVSVFPIPTFQEYIDKLLNIQTLGPSDYQTFIQSMNDPAFRRNMVKKYELSIFQDQTKNYLIYIVRLYLLSHTKYSHFFTEEESEYLEGSINLIPFFERLHNKGWTLHALDNTTTELEDQLELDACITIRNLFLQ